MSPDVLVLLSALAALVAASTAITTIVQTQRLHDHFESRRLRLRARMKRPAPRIIRPITPEEAEVLADYNMHNG